MTFQGTCFEQKTHSSQLPQQSGYLPQQSGYPPQQSGYPPQQSGYPPQQSGYPSQQSGYPPQQPTTGFAGSYWSCEKKANSIILQYHRSFKISTLSIL